MELLISSTSEQTLRSYEWLIWDFDGTLVQLEVDWAELKSTLAQAIGCPATDSLQAMLDRSKVQQQFPMVTQMISNAEIAGIKPLPMVALFRRHSQSKLHRNQ